MHYVFVGRDQHNTIIKGKCEGHSKEEVRFFYAKQKIYLTKVTTDFVIFKKKPLKTKEMLRLIEEWKSLDAAKMTIQDSLTIMMNNSSSHRVRDILQQIVLSINSGSSVIEAFQKMHESFPPLFLAILRVGLEKGTMKETLETLSEFYQEQNELQGKISSALVYPKILLLVFLVAFIVVCKFIVPSFYEMFNESNVELNKMTQVIMQSLIFIGNHLLMIGIIIISLFLLYKVLLRSTVIHRQIDLYKLKIFRRIHLIYYSYLFSRTMKLLWECGYSKNESIALCAGVIPNYYVQTSLRVVKDKMEKGSYLGSALQDAKLFDATLCKMLMIGEQGDFLMANMQNASAYYHLQYQMMLNKLVKLIEPAIILVMALLIGFIILVIFLPMLNAFRLVM